jgi:hypothetical protein
MEGGERAMIPRLGGLVVTQASTCETDLSPSCEPSLALLEERERATERERRVFSISFCISSATRRYCCFVSPRLVASRSNSGASHLTPPVVSRESSPLGNLVQKVGVSCLGR